MIHPNQRLFRLRAQDGYVVSAHLVLHHDDERTTRHTTPILLEVHGLLGHFLARGTPRQLPQALRDRGIGSFSINTRLAFAGQMTGKGIFDDTIHDIDAAVAFLEQEGFRNIFILGYSLGASMVTYWAGNRSHPHVRGIILEGTHFSLPDTQRKRLEKWGSTPTYEKLYAQAKTLLGDDPANSPHDETVVIYQARGPSRRPHHDEIFTYKTWWHMMGPEAYAAMAHRHIPKIQVPALLLRGDQDPLIEEWEGEALRDIAQEAGNSDVTVRIIPCAGHDCMDNPEAMIQEIASMVSTSKSV